METLATLNAAPRVRTWDTYTLQSGFRISTAGRRGTGTHYHLARVDQIIAEEGPHRPGTLRAGDYFSTRPVCSGNGQHTGRVIEAYDTDKVTCGKCLDYLGVR